MDKKEICGTIEQRPCVFTECPDYSSFNLLTCDGASIEVFVATKTIKSDPANYTIGRRLILSGGERQVELSVDGRVEHIRFWPARTQVE